MPASAPASEPTVIGERFPVGADARFTRKATETRWRSFSPPSPARRELASSWCGAPRRADDTSTSPRGPAVKVVYAHPSDLPDRFSQYSDLIQDDVRSAVAYVRDASGGRRSLRFDVGTECGIDYADIAIVDLPRPRKPYVDGRSLAWRYKAIHDDVRAKLGRLGYVSNLLIYADGLASGDGTVGVAGLYEDEDAKRGNRHDEGGLASIILGNSSATAPNPEFSLGGNRKTAVVHELSHALGAVQDSAPHSDGSGHCTDGADVMCHGAGRCAAEPSVWDCGGDDFFAVAPAAGSYLATHRNVYDSVFMCQVGACMPGMGNHAPRPELVVRDAAGTAVAEPPSGVPVQLDARGSSDAEGPIESWAWDLGADGSVEGTDPVLQHTFPAAGGYPVRLVVRDGAGAPNSLTTTIAAGPPPAGSRVAPATPASPAPAGRAARERAALVRARVRSAVRAAHRRLKKLGLKGFAARGLTVRFRAPVAGRIVAAVRSGSRTLARTKARSRKARTVTLRLKPSRRARRMLIHGRASSAMRVALDFEPAT